MSTSGGKRISEVMDKAGRRLAVSYRRTAELKLDPNNPRTHTPRQIKQIARSIETFGFIVPAVVDADGNIIAGHGRIFAALQLGLTEVPTISVDHLSKTQIKAFQIADNRLTENSTWNERLLGAQLKFLAESELDFSLEVTGFAMPEIDMHIEGLAGEPDPGLHRPRRHCARWIPRQWDHGDRRGAHGPALLRARARPALRGHDRETLAGLYGRASPPCLKWQVLRRARSRGGRARCPIIEIRIIRWVTGNRRSIRGSRRASPAIPQVVQRVRRISRHCSRRSSSSVSWSLKTAAGGASPSRRPW